MANMLHCSQHRHKVLNSSWTPCSVLCCSWRHHQPPQIVVAIVIFGRGAHDCTWKVAGQHLPCSQSFTHPGMLVQGNKTQACRSSLLQQSLRLCRVHLNMLICNVQYTPWSDCSRPSYRLVPYMAVKSGFHTMSLSALPPPLPLSMVSAQCRTGVLPDATEATQLHISHCSYYAIYIAVAYFSCNSG